MYTPLHKHTPNQQEQTKPQFSNTMDGGLTIDDDDVADPGKLNESEILTIETASIIVSSISMLGSCVIIFFYHHLRDLKRRNSPFHLICMMSYCDLLRSSFYMIADRSKGLCTLQAVGTSYFDLSCLLWGGSIAYTLHTSFLMNNKVFAPSRTVTSSNLLMYYIVCWGVPLIVSLLPLSTDSYGDAGVYHVRGHARVCLLQYVLCIV